MWCYVLVLKKWKAGKWWEWKYIMLAYLVKLHISLLVYCNVTVRSLCFDLFHIFCMFTLHWLWTIETWFGTCILAYAVAFFEICSFVHMVLTCAVDFEYAIDFLIMQFIIKMQFDQKMNLCIFLNCAFIFINKIHPFLWTGRNPVICKKGKTDSSRLLLMMNTKN